jgi:hypothetical protein
MIALNEIAVPIHRLRTVREESVDALVQSMADRGQLQPIVVRRDRGGSYSLVAGLHRLEAAKKLAWKEIRCTVFNDMDADQAELAEIDENLIRANLTPAEEAIHVGRRKELYEKLHPRTRHGAVGRRGKRSQNATPSQPENAFIDDVAKKTGAHRATVARKAARAKKVIVLTDVIGTSLDNGLELDALAKLPIEKQRLLAEAAKRGENVSAKSTPIDSNPGGTADRVEEVELRKAIARLRRDQPQNVDAILICNALERFLKMVQETEATPFNGVATEPPEPGESGVTSERIETQNTQRRQESGGSAGNYRELDPPHHELEVKEVRQATELTAAQIVPGHTARNGTPQGETNGERYVREWHERERERCVRERQEAREAWERQLKERNRAAGWPWS